MNIRIKKLHPDAQMPTFANPGDAGADLFAVDDGTYVYKDSSCYIQYETGIAVEIPYEHVGLLFARGSVTKTSLVLANSVGVFDAGYRGPISFRFRLDSFSVIAPTWPDLDSHVPYLGSFYKAGDRIVQIVIIPIPKIDFSWADELSESYRGAGRFGSSGE